jgi:hypothetical protein
MNVDCILVRGRCILSLQVQSVGQMEINYNLAL